MDQSGVPAQHLVKGLRRLVEDIRLREARVASGLAEVVCGKTELLCFSDCGVSYCGEAIDDLVEHPLLERVIWLLLTRSLPTEEQLADCSSVVADSAVIDQSMTEILARLPLGARPLDLFPLCISLLKFFDPTPQDTSPDAARARVWRLLAQLPLILSGALCENAEQRCLLPTELSSDETELSWAGRLLHRLRTTDDRPSSAEDAAMNILMICECLTEMRPACLLRREVCGEHNEQHHCGAGVRGDGVCGSAAE